MASILGGGEEEGGLSYPAQRDSTAQLLSTSVTTDCSLELSKHSIFSKNLNVCVKSCH